VILLGKSSKDMTVKEIMTEKVLYALPEQTVDQAMALMTDKHFRHLPVLDSGMKVIGMVSIRDLLKETISEQQFLIQQLEQYIAS
jgi:CBS domain-containing protein